MAINLQRACKNDAESKLVNKHRQPMLSAELGFDHKSMRPIYLG